MAGQQNIFTKYFNFYICNTLKKEGRAFRNIGKYILILFNQPCLFSSIIQLNGGPCKNYYVWNFYIPQN